MNYVSIMFNQLVSNWVYNITLLNKRLGITTK